MSEKGAARGHGDGLVAGARIEEFEIVRELGFGGFGITYLARDHALARLVAVKEYFPGDWGTRRADGTIAARSATAEADYAWGLERFVDEARVLARLSHHNIVKVHRIVGAAGSAYMAMEYVEGHSLAEELKSSGPLPERRVRRLLAGLAEGLAAVHAAGLLHRDIKPANVMLREGDGSPVLIDFGAARQQMGRQSRSITAVLTPGYAPIEQYSSKGRQGPWTDVYALGALAYAALSGRAPDDATERMLEDRLVPVDTASATPVSGGLAGAVEAALAVDMRQRPQDTGQWLALLSEGRAGTAGEAIVAGRGIAAAPEADTGSEGWTAGAGTNPAPAEEKSVAPANGGRARRARRRVSPLALGGAAAVLLGVVAFAVLGRGGDPVADWESEEAGLGLGVEDRVLVQRGLVDLGTIPGRGTVAGHGDASGAARVAVGAGLGADGLPDGCDGGGVADRGRAGGGGGGAEASGARVSGLRDVPGNGGGSTGELHDGLTGLGSGPGCRRGATPPCDNRVFACGGSIRGDVRGVGRVC